MTLAVTPAETVKVKFIADRRREKPVYRNLVHGLRTIITTEGIKGTYQGLAATMMKQGSNEAIRFFVMESCKNWYRQGDASRPVPKMAVGIFGAFAGACSVLGNTPLDVVKTRMQGLEASKYKNTWDCAEKIMMKEGPTAFYKGTMSRMSQVMLNVATSFVIYDSVMEILNKI